jgi:hypothetical protein
MTPSQAEAPKTAQQDSRLLLMHGACKGILWALVSGLLES